MYIAVVLYVTILARNLSFIRNSDVNSLKYIIEYTWRVSYIVAGQYVNYYHPRSEPLTNTLSYFLEVIVK